MIENLYRALADQEFKPNMINNWDDEKEMVELCKRLVIEAGYPIDANDNWMNFVYRAQELCEISEKGYCYRNVKNEDELGAFEYRLLLLSE